MSTPSGRSAVSLFGLDPATYRPHPLHSSERTYAETNCYTDILIELLHARGDEPLAAMGCTVRMDFEGDQWTFFKPFPQDLEFLYGIDIHEMQPYRPLPEQISEQIEQGQTMIIELDSWYLPDTAGTSYRTAHVKSSVVAESIDPERETLRYFHATSLYELAGEDYRGVFRQGRNFSDDVLPPYTELVRFGERPRSSTEELRSRSTQLLRAHLEHLPKTSPFVDFGGHLAGQLQVLLDGDQTVYHDYAFATVRMAGSAFEVCASYVDWLVGDAAHGASAAMREIVDGCKALSFKLARRRVFDPEPTIAVLASAWERSVEALHDALG
jgi:Domain of unknown function (DUF1839)